MGQKVSSLGNALTWKNASDSSRRNDNNATGNGNGSTSIMADQHRRRQRTLSADGCVADDVDTQPSPAVGLQFCDASTSSYVDDTAVSANMQTSSKGGSKKNHWVLRFNCRPKSKNGSKCSEPPQQQQQPPSPPPPPSTPSPPPPPPPSPPSTPTPSPPPSLSSSLSPLPSMSPLPSLSPPPSPPPPSLESLSLQSPQPILPTLTLSPILALAPMQPLDVDGMMCEACVCTRFHHPADEHVGRPIPYNGGNGLFPQDGMLDFGGSYNTFDNHNRLVLPSFDDDVMDLHSDFIGEQFMTDDFEDRAYKERAKEIQEGIEPPPGFRPGVHIQLLEFNLPNMTIDNLTTLFQRAAITAFNAPQDMDDLHRVHTSIDYIHYLVPDLQQITNCSFYWGKMDRYEAEKLLENKPEGTFLLRDSAQEEYLFSVSFRKYGRSLHARIEQWNHLFSFDSRDPGVFASSTVCGLIEHYKDPTCCMFFEPMLTIPLHRNFTFSLQHSCRAAICSQITYDDVNQLKLPKLMKSYLKEYHYKQRVRVRIFDTEN